MSDDRRASRAPPLELTFGLAGALVTLVVLGFLGYQTVAGRGEPTTLRTTVLGVQPTGDGRYEVHVSVRNNGGKTVYDAVVHAESGPPGDARERLEVTVSYLPFGSDRDVAMVFPDDPRPLLQVWVSGYEIP